MRKFGKAVLTFAVALAFAIAAAPPTAAQSGESRASNPIAVGDKVVFAGFISENQISNDVRIVGAEDEAFQQFLYRGERVYMNKGASKGAQVGELYSVIRPQGAFYHPFKNAYVRFPSFERRGDKLGFFNDEVGVARVIAVQSNTATLELVETYSLVRVGDVLQPYQKRGLPEQRAFKTLDPLAPPTGKTTGQIVLARTGREHLTSSDVVFIDLGDKAGVKIGDYFTIFRGQGSENINNFRDDETTPKRIENGSDRFRGGTYSILYPAKQKEQIDKEYPGKVLPRTIVGELVVTRVEGTTAVAVITRTQGGEVLLGDQIELQ